MKSLRFKSASALLLFDFRRVLRDPKLVALFGTILATSLFGAEVRELLVALSLLFLPVAVGWSWGADLETGALIPLAIAGNGRIRFFVTRLAVLSAFALAALTPTLLDPQAGGFRRALFIGGAASTILLGFLLVTALRTSHAGWIPLFLALAAFLGGIRLVQEGSPSRPPLSLWLLTSVVLPAFSAGTAPERKYGVTWVLFVSAVLFAGTTASILRWRAAALGRRA